VILLDTHVWVWWLTGHARMTPTLLKHLQAHQPSGLGVSVISCWEVGKLVENGKLTLSVPVDQWVKQGLAFPGIRLLELTPDIAVASTQLPQPFHRDPADQIIVATARHHNVPILTTDARILAYPHVTCLT